ncbi:hypothetical protein BDW42DRAFT_149726 [Aspergillus taichungensis]|uniref:Spherulation-specific family 4-domain-containing protein n=1 Tax=Aspergillus taichungensis TaxID=482145 RepID=A0A2J5I6B4_9EURO|nr:hypothetical protein BDW42DRAFT_149726 [Aspergillus taichungensis]
MFLGNTSHALLGLLSCLALLSQQAYTASIPSEGRLYRFGRVYHGLHHVSDSTSDSSSHGDTLEPTKRNLPSEDRLFRFGRVYQGLHHITDSTSDSSSHEDTLTPTKRTVESNSVDAATDTAPETANVIIPAYAYPTDGAWTPLENLITAHPNVHFTVIINPDSGPGANSLPDENFRAAVPKLAAHGNTRVIGYVSTVQGNRGISDVEEEIKRYAGWPSASGDKAFAVKGIFLDEAPTGDGGAAVSYYQQLASLIKQSEGLGPDNYVVTNPGAVPDAAYFGLADSTVIFESPYNEFQKLLSSDMFDKIKGTDLSKFSSIVYSIPEDTDLQGLVSQVNSISSQNYLGGLDTYMSYDPLLTRVVPLLAPSA